MQYRSDDPAQYYDYDTFEEDHQIRTFRQEQQAAD
jgi:hypothetical protein